MRKVTKIKVEGTTGRKDQFTLTSPILYSFESDTVSDCTKDFRMDVPIWDFQCKKKKSESTTSKELVEKF